MSRKKKHCRFCPSRDIADYNLRQSKYVCRTCASKNGKKYYRKNRKAKLAYAKKRTREGKNAEAVRRFVERHPGHYRRQYLKYRTSTKPYRPRK